jgi:trehalose 6-phosphate phosphatase
MDAHDAATLALQDRLRGFAAGETALFLDLDGTLADTVYRPDAVTVDPALVGALMLLQSRLGGALALISGRPLADLDRLLSPLHTDAAGLHGAERRQGGQQHMPPVPARLGEAMQHVANRIAAVDPRLWIEDKQAGFALHWREAPDVAHQAHAIMAEARLIAGTDVRLQPGDHVADLIPASATKGSALEEFLTAEPYLGRYPVYCGDDLTDESAFAVVNEIGGLSVKIGHGPTCAQARLPDSEALRGVLVAAA